MKLTWDDFSDRTGLQKVWDPAMRRIVYDELPTLSKRIQVYSTSARTTGDVASISAIGSRSTVRITAINIYSDLTSRFILKDQSGTIRVFRLPGSQTSINMQGTPKEPLYIARGGVILGHLGTLSASEHSVTIEGYEHNAEVGFVHRGGR